jgi:uncharacterized protein YidB (DUF937 family)
MGLSDILNGMLNGPGGARKPQQPSSGGSGGGMSPLMMALLGLLAYKALKGRGGQTVAPGGTQRPLPPGGTNQPLPTGTNTAGGLGDILGGLLGGAPGRAPAGTNQPLPSGANTGGGLGDILGGLLGGAPGRAGAGTTPGGGNLNDMLRGGLGGLLGGAAAGTVLSGGLDNLIKGFQQSGHGDVARSWVGHGPNQEIAPDDLEHALGSDTLDTLSQQTGMERDDLLAGLSQHLPELVDQLTPHGRVPSEEEASRMV